MSPCCVSNISEKFERSDRRMRLRSAGALDCGGRQTSLEPKNHFSWPELIGGVLLEGVTCSQIAQVIKGDYEPSPGCQKKGPVFRFAEEWRPFVLKILSDKNTIHRMALLMHRQRLKSKDPRGFISGILADNMEEMVSHPELLDAVLLLCQWNAALFTNENLFPIKFDSIHKMGPPHNSSSGLAPGDCNGQSSPENAFVEKFWRCMGETGLFLAPTAVRELEMRQLIGRLENLMEEGGRVERTKLIEELKLLAAEEGSLAINPSCRWELMKEGYCARLKQLKKEAQTAGLEEYEVPQLFSRLRKAVRSIELGVTRGRSIFSHLQDKIREVLKAGALDNKPGTLSVAMWYLNNSESPYLLIPILEEIMSLKGKESTENDILDHLEEHTEHITDAVRSVLASVHLSIVKCGNDGGHAAAEDLQVLLLYPKIVFEDFHFEIWTEYLNKIPRSSGWKEWFQKDKELTYAREYIKFLSEQLKGDGPTHWFDKLKQHVFSNPQSPNPEIDQDEASMRLLSIELVSQCIRDDRVWRAKVHSCVSDVVFESSGCNILANMEDLRTDSNLKSRLDEKAAQLRFLGIPLLFNSDNEGYNSADPRSSSVRYDNVD